MDFLIPQAICFCVDHCARVNLMYRLTNKAIYFFFLGFIHSFFKGKHKKYLYNIMVNDLEKILNNNRKISTVKFKVEKLKPFF